MVCSKKFQSLARVHLFIQQKSTEYLCVPSTVLELKIQRRKGVVCTLKELTVQQRKVGVWKLKWAESDFERQRRASRI